MPYFKPILNHVPLPSVQRPLASRTKLKDLTAEYVEARLNSKTEKNDLLPCLVNAVDPHAGARLTQLDINTEGFAMMCDSSIHLSYL